MDDLLRFSGAVEHDPQIEAWFATANPLRLLVQPWFARMRACGEDVRELFHDGGPVACIGDVPFAQVTAFKAHANVNFYRGATLPDPARLLLGEGKRMRHVTLRPGQPFDAQALIELIAAACRDIRRRLEMV